MLALLVAFAAFAVIWMEGLAGMGAALSAMLISLALLAYPAYLGIKAYRLPWIYDITTDPIDPPRYEALARLRPRDANPVAYAGLYAAEQQRTAYPDIGPLGTNATPQAAYDAALAVVNKRSGASSMRARRRPRAARAASKRWRARRSWDFATTSWSASGRTPTARASMRARPRAMARSISAPMPRASAA